MSKEGNIIPFPLQEGAGFSGPIQQEGDPLTLDQQFNLTNIDAELEILFQQMDQDHAKMHAITPWEMRQQEGLK